MQFFTELKPKLIFDVFGVLGLLSSPSYVYLQTFTLLMVKHTQLSNITLWAFNSTDCFCLMKHASWVALSLMLCHSLLILIDTPLLIHLSISLTFWIPQFRTQLNFLALWQHVFLFLFLLTNHGSSIWITQYYHHYR